jgi:hypothetical protein
MELLIERYADGLERATRPISFGFGRDGDFQMNLMIFS